jgi:hypothetical protein
MNNNLELRLENEFLQSNSSKSLLNVVNTGFIKSEPEILNVQH